MADHIENTFRIIFAGDILPGYDLAEAMPKVATIIGADITGVRAYFSGEKQFVKDELDMLTAIRYKNAFTETGAVCYVHAMLKCPKCGRRYKKAEKCPKCRFSTDSEYDGEDFKIIFDKTSAEDKRRFTRLREKAIRQIIIGTVLFAAVSFTDYLAQKILRDILWLYLIPFIPFVFGFMIYSRVKGYSPYLGCIVFMLSFGISILMLLPDRNFSDRDDGIIAKEKIIACFFICISFLWSWHQFSEWRKVHDFFSQAEKLRTISLSDIYTENEKMDALKFFIEQGFFVLKHSEIRPSKYIEITNALFEGSAEFFIRMQHRKLLQGFSDMKDIFPLKLKEEIYKFIEKKALELDDYRFAHLYQLWSYQILMPGNCPQQNMIDTELYNFIALLDYLAVSSRHSGSEKLYTSDYENKNLISAVLSSSDEIVLKVVRGPLNLKGKTAVFRFCSDCYPRSIRIGGNLQDKYLGSHSVFADFSPAIILFKRDYDFFKSLMPHII